MLSEHMKRAEKKELHAIKKDIEVNNPKVDFEALYESLHNTEVYPTFYTLETKKKIAGIYYLITLGNISETMRRMGMHRQTFHYWMNSDDMFKLFIDGTDVEGELLDLAQTALEKSLTCDNESVRFQAGKFVKLTKGKEKGWTYRDNLLDGMEIQDDDDCVIVIPDNGRNDPIGPNTKVTHHLPDGRT
jgi:hypothetical protein